jgi:hypothetical protein
MSDQDNQNYALMAAAAAAAYAQKKARDEARKALIISTALNQNMSSLDPKTQAELQQLLQAEARRVRQENFEWTLGWWILGIIAAGFVLFFLILVGAASCSSHSYGSAPTAMAAQAVGDTEGWHGKKAHCTYKDKPLPGTVIARNQRVTSIQWGGPYNGTVDYTNEELQASGIAITAN